jgi:uncharacterized protein (DUF1330 family)
MPAYIIVFREEPLRDPAEMAEYQRKTREMKIEIKPKPLVVYGAMEALEGDKPDGVVMLEFPTVEDAKAWYNSPDYQAALPHRLKSAKHRAIIVDGFAMPKP